MPCATGVYFFYEIVKFIILKKIDSKYKTIAIFALEKGNVVFL
jgi:hypothetical protein